MKLTGNTIFITGGGSGIGKGLAESLHQLGNKVIIAGRRKGHLATVVEANPGMDSFELDLSSPESIATVSAELVKKYPQLNVLINNAGAMPIADVGTQLPDDHFSSTIMTNFLGPVRLTNALVEHLKSQKDATIVTVTSVVGFRPVTLTAVYSAAKAALHSYTMSLRYRLRNSSVSVIEVIPPWVKTELFPTQDDEPRAMPLKDFLEQTIELLGTGAPENLVQRALEPRGSVGPDEYERLFAFNDAFEKGE